MSQKCKLIVCGEGIPRRRQRIPSKYWNGRTYVQPSKGGDVELIHAICDEIEAWMKLWRRGRKATP